MAGEGSSTKLRQRRNGGGAADDAKAGAQYHCDYCRKDITNVVRIRCAECNDFDLCLECFSVGVEVYPHKNDHKYRVMDHVTTPIFDEEWGADEELLLLEAIEMYGLGNWSDVADHVGTKSKAKCEQHYYEVYLSGKTAPLPDLEQPLISMKKSGKADSVADADGGSMKQEESKGSKSNIQAKTKKTGLGHLVGYIPHRGDFDTEYDNDAELILAEMDFKPEDTQAERELKLKVLQIYNAKLDARLERKQFVLERGLLDGREKKRTKEERDLEARMRVFARFHSVEEHDQFIEGLLNEQRLRKRIEQLQHYRMNGITTLAEAEQYEMERNRRDLAENIRKQREGVPFLYDAAGSKKRNAPSAAPGATTAKRQKGAPLDLTGLEGLELLSVQEQKLCSELRIIPRHYLMIKDQIIRESYQRGFLKPGQVHQLIKIDVHKTSKIFDFFVSVGWVNGEPADESMMPAGANANSNATVTGGPGAPNAASNSSSAPSGPSAAQASATRPPAASSGSSSQFNPSSSSSSQPMQTSQSSSS